MSKIKSLLLVFLMASSSWADEITLLMVPDDPKVVKIGLDITSHHPSILLVKYKLGAQNTARIFGWKGTEWVTISNSNFINGKFFKEGPKKTIIVESDYIFPNALIPREDWCANVYKISTTQTSSLIHLLGINIGFNNSDWQSFSNIYNLPISKINPNFKGLKWYHRRLSDVVRSSEYINSEDKKYWTIIREEEHSSLLLNDLDNLTSIEYEDDLDIKEEEIEINNPLSQEPPEAVISN